MVLAVKLPEQLRVLVSLFFIIFHFRSFHTNPIAFIVACEPVILSRVLSILHFYTP